MFIGIFVSVDIFYCIYLFNDANTFKEYTDSIYLTSSTMVITITGIIIASNMKKEFELIDQFEEAIENRECKKFQNKNNNIQTDSFQQVKSK